MSLNQDRKYKKKADLPVFVVDDSREALTLLSRILSTNGFKVFPFESGFQVVDQAKEINPCLIILDIMMPEIDGLEVCRNLKADAQTKEIPVIFISALGDTITINEGFKVGGVDYITKPIHINDVLARINTHAQLFSLQQELVEKNRLLEEEIRSRERSKKALEESLQLFQGLFNTSPDAIVLIDPHDRKVPWSIVDCNKATCQMNGYTKEELVGQSIDILNADNQSMEDHDRYFRNLQKNKSVSLETTHKHKDGHMIPIEVLTSIVIIGGKEYVLGIDRDITERKKFEADLIEAKEKAEESDSLKSAFLANMSHEIRTPLNSILGFSELLGDPDLDPDDREEYSRLIETSGNNLLTIINDIIDISKIESGLLEINPRPLNVKEFINNFEEQFTLRVKQRGLSFIVKNCSDEVCLVSDESKISQVLANFTSNAIKFTDKGVIEVGVVVQNTRIKFYVKDTGIGIPQEHQKQIFERFRQIENAYTRKYGGNGLGLAISKHLVELLGGEIGFDSVFQQGSTFYFTLPVTK